MQQVSVPQREQKKCDIITPIDELTKNISTTTKLVQGDSDSSCLDSDSDASLITLMGNLSYLHTSTSSKKILKKKSSIAAKKSPLPSKKSFMLASS
ncbi:LOW QUALITY PROTEIN: hypothetical protein PanWU01x14_251450 [Parasponia andersonii]|uniref:Uncharacterized protein n=1 Tax=Parasponia andersonii TaxID=3476 RepID=A0A2P5BCH7_PARAD|nr:LOW QUALITY PROTEIN: hypothetical protein PanWU01x14_251450 [Parasponia andersonii]